MTGAEKRALKVFAEAFADLSICEYRTGRLEGMLERPHRGSGDPDDVKKWRRMDQAWKRLVTLELVKA